MTRFFSRRRARAGSDPRAGHRAGTAPAVILMYHRVATPRDDPFGLAVSPSSFRDHLEILQSRCRLVPLDEILDADVADREPLASITFDDGYADNLAVASPMLRDAGIPATFFVCTGSLGDSRGFWWDRVASAFAATGASSTALEGMHGIPPVGDLTSHDARTQATLGVATALRPMHPAARDRLVEEIEVRLPPRAGEQREAHPVIDEAGLLDLASQPRTEIGAHTAGHPMLSQLSLDEQRDEITRSVTAIHDVTGTRPRFLAYPYGGRQDYDHDSCLAAADAGMTAAFANHGGRFDPARRPYRVPRHNVPALPAEDLRTWLDGILAP